MLVTELRDETQLYDLRPEWDDLLRRSRTAGIFQTWEWNSVYWRYFGVGKQLTLLCVRDSDRLVGIAPLKTTLIHGLPLRRVRLLGSRASDYLDLILDQEAEAEALESVFGWLETNEKRWDILDLEKIPEDSPTLEHWPELRRRFGWRNSASPYGMCPYVPLPRSWDEMRALLSRKQRSNLSYKERLIRRDFHAEIGPIERDGIDEGLDALVRLHTRRWEERGLPGGLSLEASRLFLRDISTLFSKRGWLRMYGLRLDGELQSVHYCMAYRDKEYGYIGGWEPSLARYGLGSVLTAHAIRQAIEEGLSEFDMLCGDESYKSHWARASHTNHRLIARKGDPRSRLAAALSRAERKIGIKTKMLLSRCLAALNIRRSG